MDRGQETLSDAQLSSENDLSEGDTTQIANWKKEGLGQVEIYRRLQEIEVNKHEAAKQRLSKHMKGAANFAEMLANEDEEKRLETNRILRKKSTVFAALATSTPVSCSSSGCGLSSPVNEVPEWNCIVPSSSCSLLNTDTQATPTVVATKRKRIRKSSRKRQPTRHLSLTPARKIYRYLP